MVDAEKAQFDADTEKREEKFSNCCFARILWDGRCGQCKEQCVPEEDETSEPVKSTQPTDQREHLSAEDAQFMRSRHVPSTVLRMRLLGMIR